MKWNAQRTCLKLISSRCCGNILFSKTVKKLENFFEVSTVSSKQLHSADFIKAFFIGKHLEVNFARFVALCLEEASKFC